MKSTLPTNNSLLSRRQNVVNKSTTGFAKHFKQPFLMKKAFASLMLTIVSLLFVGNAFGANTIVLANTSVSGLTTSAPLASGATNQVVYGFALTAGDSAGTITALTFTTSATTIGSLSNFRLYNNGTTTAYNSGTATLVGSSGTPTPTTVPFSSLSTNNSFIIGTTYFYLICDVAANPSGSPFSIYINAAANLTTATNTTAASNTFPLYSILSAAAIPATQIVSYAALNQTIGLFPGAQGGLENMINEKSSGKVPYLLSNFWNYKASTNNPVINTASPNTGNTYITYPAVAANTKYMMSPAACSFAASQVYVIQFAYRTSNANTGNMSAALTTTNGGSYALSTIVFPTPNGTWQKTYVTVTAPSTATDGAGSVGFRTGASVTLGALIDFDDIVVYPYNGTAPDTQVPNNVTGQSAIAGNASNVLNWTVATDQATNTSGLAGYIVVRGTAALTGAPNSGGVYSIGNTLGNGAVVGLIPSGTTTFTDNGLTNGTQYFYAIYAVDNAFNYSATSATCSGTPFVPANYFWNGASNIASPAGGGTGTWGATNNWRIGTNTGAQATWADNSAATIARTPAGTITIAANIIPTSTTVSTTGYTLATGASAITMAGSVALGTSAITLAPAASQSLTLSGAISGSGLITVSGGNTAATTVLSAANANTGGVTLTGGTLAINNASALGASGTLTINGGALDNTSGGSITTVNYLQSWGSDFTFTGSNALNLGTGAVTLTVNRIVTTTASTLTVGGIIGGGFSLTKAGAGTLALTGANTFSTGTVTVNGGTLEISANQTITNLTITSGTLLIDAGITLTITGAYSASGGAITNNGTINLNSSGISFPGTATTTTFNSLQISANATLNSNLTLGTSGVLTFTSGLLSDAGYTLTILNTSAAAITGSTATKYVADGSLKLSFPINLTTTSYTYPLGTSGGSTAYLPFVLAVGTNGILGCAATVQAFNGTYTPGTGGTLSPVSTTEYWTLTTFTGTGTGNFITLAASMAKATIGTNNSIGVNTTGSSANYASIGGSSNATVGALSNGVGPSTGAITGSVGTAGTFYLALGFAGTNFYWNGANVTNNTTSNLWDNNTSLNWSSPLNTTFSSGAGVAWPNTGTNIANFNNTATATGSSSVTIAGTITAPFNTVLGTNYTFATVSSAGNLAGNINLGGNTLTTAPVGVNNLTLSGTISNGSLTQSGTGTTVLSGTNTFTGGVSIGGSGALQLGSAGAINSTTPNAVTFTSGSTGKLQINGNNLTVPSLNTNATPGSPVIENGVAGAKTLTINSAGTSTYAGVIQDAAAGTLALTNSGAGTVTLSGNHTYSGTTTNSAGSLILSGNNTGTGALSVTAGSVTFAGTNAFTGSPAVTVSALAQLNINNAAVLPNATTINVNTTGILDNTSGFPITLTNVINIGNLGAALTFTGSNSLNLGTGTYGITAGHTITVTNNTLTIGGVLGDGGAGKGVTKSGLGTLVLSGANTFTGGVSLSAGTLNINNTAALGTGTFSTPANAGLVVDNTSGSSITISNAASWLAGFTFTGSNNLTMTGAIAIPTNGVSLVVNAGTLTLSGVITGNHSVNKSGAGTLVLSGASVQGTTTVSAGILKVAGVGTTANSPIKASCAVSGTGTLDLNGQTILFTGGVPLSISGTGTSSSGALTNSSVTAATYSGAITLGATSSVVSGGDLSLRGGIVTASGKDITLGGTGTASSVGSVISGAGSLIKTGSGTWALGAANTYTGSTTVNAGTLEISANETLTSLDLSGGGSLTVDNGVTLTISGTFTGGAGTITNNGTIVLNGGAVNFPGTTGVTIAAFKNLTIGTTDVTLTKSLSMTGTLTLNSANLIWY